VFSVIKVVLFFALLNDLDSIFISRFYETKSNEPVVDDRGLSSGKSYEANWPSWISWVAGKTPRV